MHAVNIVLIGCVFDRLDRSSGNSIRLFTLLVATSKNNNSPVVNNHKRLYFYRSIMERDHVSLIKLTLD
jgi:hypothetical protein